MTRIAAIQRWPVKGLGPDPLEDVELRAGDPLAFDRAWAIENGPSGFDPVAPKPLPKSRFLMLMKNERLAALATAFDAETRRLTIFRHGKQVAAGRLDEPVGRSIIEQFFAAYMANELRGVPRLLSAEAHTFSDVGAPVVSLIGQGSLAELERVAGRTIDPLRFRANFHMAGLAPWAEFDLIGHRLALGADVVLRVIEPITRCAATNVDPATGARDMQIPRLIDNAFGHSEFGVYAEVVQGGRVRRGDAMTVLDETSVRPALPF